MKRRKLSGCEFERHESKRDVWREVLDGIDEIKAGGGKRCVVAPKTEVAKARIKTGLSRSLCRIDGRIEKDAGTVGTGAARTVRGGKNIDQDS